MINYNACYLEHSKKALLVNNLALIVQRIDFIFRFFLQQVCVTKVHLLNINK